MRKIIGILVCMMLFGTVLPVSGTIKIEKNAMQTINDGTLSGYVNDPAMNPIEGALVRVYFHGAYEEAYTDSLGYYHVTDIPICYCFKNCTASKTGYKSEWVLLGIVENTTYDFMLVSGNVLYVGGSGPGNYTSIQEAVDDALDGDTVFVYDDSSPYYEIIFLDENKSIKLLGEDKDTTVIDANNLEDHVVEIRADGVEFSGFTVQNSGHFAGIMVTSSKNFIHDCNIYHNIRGIQLQAGIWNEKPYPKDNVISNNRFENNSNFGLIVYGNINCSIIGNIAINNKHGIHVADGSNNIIRDNIAKNNVDGLGISGSYNKISNNLLQNNSWRGIDVIGGNINVITENNFIDNGPHGYEHANFYMCWWQYWRGNFWSPRRFQPSDSTTPVMINSVGPIFEFPPRLNFDWRPATEPYEI